MIDIHCHILPDIDDGPRSLDETIAMARTALKNGIHTVVATPHTENGIYCNNFTKIQQSVAEVRKALRGNGILLKIISGAEVHACPGLVDLVKNGEAVTINNDGKYLLLELPSMAIPHEIKDEIFNLKLHGITPIIAHPERNLVFQQDPGRLEEFIRMGVICQVTASSITGELGKETQKCAETMLRSRLLHVIASDSHSVSHRPQNFQMAVEKAGEIMGSRKEAEDMVNHTPAAIIAGHAVEVPDSTPVKKKTWFSFFKG